MDLNAFPMHMGMNRLNSLAIALDSGVPHAHGDEPQKRDHETAIKERSPCTWG